MSAGPRTSGERSDSGERCDSPGWIVSPAFDVAFFVGPSLFALAVVAFVPGARTAGSGLPLWAWVACVLLVDVAHVWSTLFRTYLDPSELARRRTLYAMVPAFCFLGGVVIHALDDRWFWRVLAYLAVLHFVRQQYGFVALYGRRGAWASRWDFHIDRAAIYSATLYPLVYWHTHGRPFAWFVPGDFASLGEGGLAPLGRVVEPLARLVWMSSLAAFAARQMWLAKNGTVAIGRILMVASTALIWYVGIVGCEADFAFTVTNCVAHGVPYLALVWLYNRRKWGPTPRADEVAATGCTERVRVRERERERAPRLLALVASRSAIPVYLGICTALAWVEEAVWDNLVWRERTVLFGDVHSWLDAVHARDFLVFLVPLLALPQAVHYVLDAFIWKLDGSNPGIERYLLAGEENLAPGASRPREASSPREAPSLAVILRPAPNRWARIRGR